MYLRSYASPQRVIRTAVQVVAPHTLGGGDLADRQCSMFRLFLLLLWLQLAISLLFLQHTGSSFLPCPHAPRVSCYNQVTLLNISRLSGSVNVIAKTQSQ